MKINKLKISNFLGLEHLEMDLSNAPLHLIVGENEQGKSSIKDAIAYGLTGEARGFKTHNSQASLIREGAKFAEVIIETPHGTIQRRKTPKSPATSAGPIPDDRMMASIVSDPLIFLSLPDDSRREVLFRMLPGLNPTPAQIRDRLMIFVPASKPSEAHPPTMKLIEELAKLAADKGFSDAADEAIIRRRLAKQRMADVPGAPDPTFKTFNLPDIKEAEVEAGIATLKTERDALLQKRGEIHAKCSAQVPALPLGLDLPAVEQKLAEVCKLGEQIELPDPGEIKEWEDALTTNRPILTELAEKVDALEVGKAPRFYPKICPTFNDLGLECPNADIMGFKGREAPDPEKAKKLNGDLQEQREEVTRLEAGLNKAQVKKAAYEKYTSMRQVLSDRIVYLKEVAELDQQTKALDERMQNGRDLLEALKTYQRLNKEGAAARAQSAAAEKEAQLYDSLAKALAPDGIPSKLIAEALDPINKLLMFASGYLFPEYLSEPLRLTKDLEIYRGIIPYALLSKSARYRTGICFQYALARLAGARLLLIDEADVLDPPNRSQLVSFFLAIRQDFDSILCFGTSDHADPSPLPDIIVWWMENGQVSKLTVPKAA